MKRILFTLALIFHANAPLVLVTMDTEIKQTSCDIVSKVETTLKNLARKIPTGLTGDIVKCEEVKFFDPNTKRQINVMPLYIGCEPANESPSNTTQFFRYCVLVEVSETILRNISARFCVNCTPECFTYSEYDGFRVGRMEFFNQEAKTEPEMLKLVQDHTHKKFLEMLIIRGFKLYLVDNTYYIESPEHIVASVAKIQLFEKKRSRMFGCVFEGVGRLFSRSFNSSFSKVPEMQNSK